MKKEKSDENDEKDVKALDEQSTVQEITADRVRRAVLMCSFAHAGTSDYENGLIKWVNSMAFYKVDVLVLSGAVCGTPDHPVDFKTIKFCLPAGGLHEPIKNLGDICELKDTRSDEEWLTSLLSFLGCQYGDAAKSVKLLVGGEVAQVLSTQLEKSGSSLLSWPNIEVYEPSRIFKRNSVQNMVHSDHTMQNFLLGCEITASMRFPTSFQTVDVILVDPYRGVVYMCRKRVGDKLMFIGGFTDPADESLEQAAVRECREETGCKLMDPEYLGSFRINDWRYRFQQDKIMTALFLGETHDRPCPNDDIAEIDAIPIRGLDEVSEDVEPAHAQLFSEAVKVLQRTYVG